MPLETVRYWIEKSPTDRGGTMESKDLARMRDQLERDIGLSLAAIIDLTKRWPV